MGESSIIHLGLIKLRAVGAGNVAITVSSFDNLNSLSLIPLPLTATTSRVLQRLGNYSAQGIKVKFAASAIDDTIRCQDITLFVKQLYTEYPM